MDFGNKTVLITGGIRGIGLAIAERFLAHGAAVHILDRDISDDCPLKNNNQVAFHQADVSVAAEVKQVFKEVEAAAGRLDILVNNAGIIRDAAIWKMSEEDYDAVLNVNLKGCWLTCREAAPIMRKQKSGRIINIASRAWLGNFGQSNYSASKGGLISMTRVLALELARSNVTVNAVAPGLIETTMTKSLSPEVYESLLKKQPGGKAGTPADIASAVAYLASDEASFINGQVLHVDGGRSIGSTVF